MKEIINAVLFVVSLYAGTRVLVQVHNEVRIAALEKAAQGLPSLTKMTQALQKKKEKPREVKK